MVGLYLLPTTEHNEIQELIASFSNLGLDDNLSLFMDTDIVPYHLSHHYLLHSDNSPTPLLPSTLLGTLFFLTPPLSLNHSQLTLISPSFDLNHLASTPLSPILSHHHSQSSSLSHTPKNSTPTFPLPTFTLPSISRPLSLEHLDPLSQSSQIFTMATPSMPACDDRTAPTFDPHQP